MGCGAAGGLSRHPRWQSTWPPSCILPKNRNYQKRQKLKNFDVIHVNYDIIKHCGAFCVHFALFFNLKKVKNTQFLPKYGLATCCL